MRLIIVLLVASPLTAAQVTFEAKWKRLVRPDAVGVLSIGEKGISFTPRKEGKGLLAWAFKDIQHLDRSRPNTLAIQSYTDSLVAMGRDRWYRFDLLDETLADQLYQHLVAKTGKPATDRVVSEPQEAQVSIPAKHLRRFKGSEGTLYFSTDWIVYRTATAGASRKWRLGRDVVSVWSSDPYRLEVHVLGGTEAFVPRPSVHRFSLKTRLDPAFYTELKMQIYGLNDGR